MISSFAFVVACGSSNGSNGNDGNDGNDGTGENLGAGLPPEADQPSAPSADMNLFGRWSSTCRDAEAFGLTEDSVLEFEGAAITRVTRVSATGDCSSVVAEVKRVGNYSSGAEVRIGVRAIDLTTSTLMIKPLNETGVAILRLANFCGIANWAIGVERDVTAQSGGLRCFDRVPSATFDIYSVEESRLFFGLAGGDRSMRANRPLELDRQNFFSQK